VSFRQRLALFLVATLALVQVLTALLVYGVTRERLIEEGGRQLTAAGDAFLRQLDDVSARVADNVQVLALDFALRSAIAQRDRATVLSALRNHGRRVGAARVQLLGVDGTVQADTRDPDAKDGKFALPQLLERALQTPSAAVVAMQGRAYWTVVVPVFAPTLIGLIAADIPIDDRVLAKLQKQSALPRDIELVTPAGQGWSVIARGSERLDLADHVVAALHELPLAPRTVDVAGREYVALAVKLGPANGGAPVIAVLGYSVDAALEPFRSVATAWTTLLGIGLAAGLFGAYFIARSVARPVESLAATARRIAAGDYREPAAIEQSGEIGDLAAAFGTMARAISEREERIRHQAGHDAATGLPNLLSAEAHVDHRLLADAQPGALVMVGVAHLPVVIKTMGHAIADRLMDNAGTRLRQVCTGEFLAHAGYGSFAIWTQPCERAQAIQLAFRALDALAEPYQEAEMAIDLAPAAGIALFPAHGARASVLLQRAEVALFAATASPEPVIVYDPATDPHRPERLSLMGDLREALDHGGGLQLHYQPKLAIAESRVDGAEALVRWTHPRRGFVPPDAFIALAEETGNVHRLTRWVLATGIAQASAWSQAGRVLRTSLNVSARDLADRDLPRRVGELLAVHGVAPEQMVLEITESAVMSDPDAATRVLRDLADRGLEIAIDDFGVGHSSLAYLHRLPVRELKIDKAFVRNLAQDANDQSIVRAIVDLGHRLGFRITAEGVEDQGALDYLAAIGCDHAQGYLIAKALPVDAFEGFLRKGDWRAH
jgi:predicted signal transduction protein with EAL and GGDEF domain